MIYIHDDIVVNCIKIAMYDSCWCVFDSLPRFLTLSMHFTQHARHTLPRYFLHHHIRRRLLRPLCLSLLFPLPLNRPTMLCFQKVYDAHIVCPTLGQSGFQNHRPLSHPLLFYQPTQFHSSFHSNNCIFSLLLGRSKSHTCPFRPHLFCDCLFVPFSCRLPDLFCGGRAIAAICTGPENIGLVKPVFTALMSSSFSFVFTSPSNSFNSNS